jgi:hypothetical protein
LKDWEETKKRQVMTPSRLENEIEPKKKRKKRIIDPSVIANRRPREKKIVGEVFNGISFVITGFESEMTSQWQSMSGTISLQFYINLHISIESSVLFELCKAIVSNHGVIIDSLETISSFKRGQVGDFPNLILISNTNQRTAKYLLAVALGIPCLHSSWVNDSLKNSELEFVEAYRLEIGYSFITSGFIET